MLPSGAFKRNCIKKKLNTYNLQLLFSLYVAFLFFATHKLLLLKIHSKLDSAIWVKHDIFYALDHLKWSLQIKLLECKCCRFGSVQQQKKQTKKNTLNNKNATEDKSSVMSEIHSSPLTPAPGGAGLRNHLVVWCPPLLCSKHFLLLKIRIIQQHAYKCQ